MRMREEQGCEEEFDRSAGFMCFKSFIETAERLCNKHGKETAFDFLMMIANYALYEVEPAGNAPYELMFPILKEQIDASQRRREAGFKKEDHETTDRIWEYKRSHPNATQREIAVAIGCSPGKVNSALKKLEKQQRANIAPDIAGSGSNSPVHDTVGDGNKCIYGGDDSPSGHDGNVHSDVAVNNNNSVNVNVNVNSESEPPAYRPRLGFYQLIEKEPDELYSKLCSELPREEFMRYIYREPSNLNSYLFAGSEFLKLLIIQPDELRSRLRSRLSQEEFMQLVYGEDDEEEAPRSSELPW